MLDDLFIAFFIRDQQAVEFLNACVRSLDRRVEAGRPYYKSMVQGALGGLTARVGSEANRSDLHMNNRLVTIAALRCSGETDNEPCFDLREDMFERDRSMA